MVQGYSIGPLATACLLRGIFLLMSPLLSAWDWPIGEPRIQIGFGHFDGTMLSRGVLLTGAEAIEPIHDGEVIFVQRHGTHVLGRFVIIAHENGLRSLYSHLGEIALQNRNVTAGQKIASSGDFASGYSQDDGFGLRIIDHLQGGYINPAVLLPHIADNAAPIIDSVTLVGDGVSYRLQENSTVQSSRVELLLTVLDYRSSRRRIALPPYGIEVTLDERPPRRLLYEVIDERDGMLYLLPTTPLDRIGAEPWQIDLGSFRLAPGPHRLTLRVWDSSGNSSTRRINFLAAGRP